MQYIASQSAQKPTVFHTDFAACNTYANGEQAARAVTCPTLLLLCQRDVMTTAKTATGVIAAIQQAKVVQINACGHALMAEQPDAVHDDLFQFATSATISIRHHRPAPGQRQGGVDALHGRDALREIQIKKFKNGQGKVHKSKSTLSLI